MNAAKCTTNGPGTCSWLESWLKTGLSTCNQPAPLC